MEGPPLPAYHEVRARAHWSDAEGRLYACVCERERERESGPDGVGNAPHDARTCAASLVLLPIAATRRAAGGAVRAPEFPEPGDTVVIEGAERRVDAVQRVELQRAVALITWLPVAKRTGPRWLQ
jgi:hypothetical protein